MSNYLPGRSNVRDLNKRLAEYREVERQIEDAITEKRHELARIQASKNKLKTRATYEPTPEALDYWQTHCLTVAQQPRPTWGGPGGLRKAAAEAAAHDAAKGEA